jgi:2-oxoglutarate dehydrogenase E1 component
MDESPEISQLRFWQEFQGPNSGYVLELYEQYLQNPNAVDAATRTYFDGWEPPQEIAAPLIEKRPGYPYEKVVAVANLAQSIRTYGHLCAQLDPLGSEPTGDPSLDPDYHGLSTADLRGLPASLVGGPILATGPASQSSSPLVSAFDAIQALREIYCGKIGYDYGHIFFPEERVGLREVAETRRFRPPQDTRRFKALLERLTQVETFERFLQRNFPGKTRFSIEGLDMLVPMLDEIVNSAADANICMIFLGMGHRGRLNVLAHVLQKPYDQILAEFSDPGGNPIAWHQMGWTGDVKYHQGGSRAVEGGEEVKLVIVMPPNPSHLELVNPVIEGMAHAADSAVNRPGLPIFYPYASLPILIHGDASFPGQGVVAETLNLSGLPGYFTAGTIHLLANNQLGYTATAGETRSSPYPSDLAKGLKIPVLHVNADDPLACLEAAGTAFAYRARFQKDFLIDLVGYRRYGHNEGDEPTFTQPVMYRKIEELSTVRTQWAKSLAEDGIIEAGWPETLVQGKMSALQTVLDGLKPEEALLEPIPAPPPSGAARKVKTGVKHDRLRELNEALLKVADGFRINPKFERGRKRRQQAFDDPDDFTVDWSSAEQLAFASILQDGIAIRLTGQDVIRGTFSQRHAAYYDIEDGQAYIPLHTIPGSRASFEVRNSPLSENAALGFEFGYSLQSPAQLVIWEAQYGDFVNGAQAMIDEFISSARAKWGQTPSLVMLLPHGNEGQGPDHSSARLERFLRLAAEVNMRLVNPTTASQYFHLLRRQAALLKTDPLPLIVFTPKGLLRHPRVASRPLDLVKGAWQPILVDELPEADENSSTAAVRRLILCSGRVYIDLVGSPLWEKNRDAVVARLEQLYPFPVVELRRLLEQYPKLEQVTWVQEEPLNMGAWGTIQPYLVELAGGRLQLNFVGRLPSSSPAEGSANWYATNQRALVECALHPEKESTGAVASGVLIQRGISYA